MINNTIKNQYLSTSNSNSTIFGATFNNSICMNSHYIPIIPNKTKFNSRNMSLLTNRRMAVIDIPNIHRIYLIKTPFGKLDNIEYISARIGSVINHRVIFDTIYMSAIN